jgi:AcrR family transcriptional regulator
VRQTTVSDIMERAGMARESFYYHFRSKDELVTGVLNSYAKIFAADIIRWSDDLDEGKITFEDFPRYLRLHFSCNEGDIGAMCDIARETGRIDSVVVRLADYTIEALKPTSFYQLCLRCCPAHPERALRFTLYATILMVLEDTDISDEEMARITRSALNIPDSL